MKFYKKIGFGLAFLALALVPTLLVSHKALAVDVTDLSQVCVPPYTPTTSGGRHTVNGWLSASFTDRADITATYSANGNCATPAGSNSSTFFGSVTFAQIFQNISGQSGVLLLTDSQADSNVSYGEAVGGSGQDDTRIDQFASNLDNLMQDPLGGHDAIVSTGDLSKALASTEVTLGLETDDVSYGCDSSVSNENFVLVDANPPKWECDDSANIAGDKGLILGAGNFANLDNFNVTFTASTGTDGDPVVQSVYPNEQADRTFSWCTSTSQFRSQNCTGDLILEASQADITNLGTGTGQFTIKSQKSGTSFPVTVAGSGATASQQKSPAGSTGNSSGDLCATASNSPLSWLGCPVLNAANDLLVGNDGQSGLVGLFEDQLSFRVSDLNGNNGQESVQKIWALIRDISSAVIVIILLIMIISQAVGGGPFDAYTVRKLLPKLVAAVILMQLSWAITSWVVNTVDDLGRGLADIMYFPFGGAANMGLGNLLSHSSVGSGVAGQGANTSLIMINWVVLLAGGVLLVAALPVVLVFAFTAVISLLAALATLIFRKILIIACLIFAPLAIAAWILPGTQSYYKLWKDNFLKALMMFPLAVAIVATGRIFAYIVGTQKNGIFLNMIFVLVGYFGVLFILPKTFKWGGTIMTAGSNTINGLVTKASAGAKEPIKGFGQRWQGEKAKKYNPQAGTWSKAYRRVQSGHILPTERSRRLTIASGDKWAGERNEEADAYVKRSQEMALKGYDAAMTDEDGNFISGIHRNEAGQMTNEAGEVVRLRRDAAADYRGADRTQAEVEHMTGVEGGKQALIDIAGNSGNSVTDKRASQAAIKQLLDTHSEIELQGSRISRSSNNSNNGYVGRRISEVPLWQDTITNSPQHYSAINNSRPDMAPDLIQSAEGRVDDTYDDAYKDANVDTRTQRLRKLDAARLNIAMERMSPEQLQNVHYGMFQDIARVGNEQVKVINPVTGQRESMTLSQQLAGTIRNFNESGSTVGINSVGSLRGGKEIHVNSALAADGSGQTLDTVAPPNRGRTDQQGQP